MSSAARAQISLHFPTLEKSKTMESFELPTKFWQLLSILFFCSLELLSAQFSPSDNHHILCGSSSNATVDNRFFTGDSVAGPAALRLSATKETSAKDPSASLDSSALYKTARIFTKTASYEFTIKAKGQHMVRLHFSPFAPDHGAHLSSAVFDVSALGYVLLRNFSVPGKTHVTKEYIIAVDAPALAISFAPSGNSPSSSRAFVNAIEVISVPEDLIPDAARYITPAGFRKFGGLRGQILETVHRINAGGSKIAPSGDALWRSWIPDDKFLLLNDSGKAVQFDGRLNYQSGGSSRETAPGAVYSTARAMNTEILENPRFNMSWDFPVKQNIKHLVRLHICDIVSKTATQLIFDVFINGMPAYEDLHPSEFTMHTLASPFYIDFAVDSESAGVIRLSIGPSYISDPLKINAILNGLEIMMIKNSAGNLADGQPLSNSNSKSRLKMDIILVISVLGGLVCIACVIWAIFCTIRRRNPPKKPPKEAAAEGSHLINIGLRIPFVEIRSATKNFSEDSIIGSGGFGKVYRGVLRNGRTVAVKRAMPGSKQGLSEFLTEITLLSRIRHRHLVSLIGYCHEQSEMILVYEFMEKGPLKKHLYGSTGIPCLTWKQRLEICIGAAKGLHYLHTGYLQGIIHRDVKSSNILLGDDYLAKVADFGLSKLRPSLDQTHVSTAVKGSFGYLDPEYYRRHQLTDKSDIYSFGVVLLEVLCARPATNASGTRNEENIVEWAMDLRERGLLESIVDPRLAGEISDRSLKKFWETAEKCLADRGADRPAIGEVLWSLEHALQLHEGGAQREQPEEHLHPQTVHRSAQGGRRADVVAEEQSGGMTEQVFSQLFAFEGR